MSWPSMLTCISRSLEAPGNSEGDSENFLEKHIKNSEVDWARTKNLHCPNFNLFVLIAASSLIEQMKPLVILAAFLAFSVLSQIIADLNSDRQALLEFDASVRHLRNFGWNDSIPVCKWFGITCRKDGTRVIALRLPGVGLYGVLPDDTIAKLDALKVVSLRSNHLIGTIPSKILSMPNLQYLYLHHNNFSGNIDIPLDLSTQLSVIDLSFNSLSGEIPSTINNLTRLSTLNLQFNSFSGVIPDLNIPKLKNLNVSHNLLNGTIPDTLNKFPDSSFIGNSHLCGPPLANCNTVSPAPSPSSDSSLPEIPEKHISKKLNVKSIVAIVIGGSSIAFLVIFAVVFCCLRKKKVIEGISVLKKPKSTNNNVGKNVKSDDFGSGVPEAEKNKLVFFEGCSYNFNLEDLLRASAEVLGKGSYGTTYKAIMDDATMVVVKRLRETTISKKDFEQHMEIFKSVGQHPSIVPLRAYYCSKDERLLVYEYMPSGSFSAALHDDTSRTRLDWETRLKISLGVARGISHIHSSKLLHGNIKASNVLLTKDLEGCISDVGLYSLMNFLAIKSRGVGYYAPEVIETRKVTQKSDVYSFGVLLLEMLTGKSPVNTTGLDYVIDLPRWVRSVVREEWTAEVFDAELLKYQNVEEEMVQMLQIALSCVVKSPDSRPTIDEVVQMMEGGRHSEGEYRTSSEDNRSKGSNVQTPS